MSFSGPVRVSLKRGIILLCLVKVGPESTKRGISGSRIPRKVLPSEEGFAQKSRSFSLVSKLNEFASLSEAASLSQAIELSEDVVLSEAISVIEAPTLIKARLVQ